MDIDRNYSHFSFRFIDFLIKTKDVSNGVIVPDYKTVKVTPYSIYIISSG